MLWRPVAAGWGHYDEIARTWSLDELLEAHEALDEQDRQRKRMMDEQERAMAASRR